MNNYVKIKEEMFRKNTEELAAMWDSGVFSKIFEGYVIKFLRDLDMNEEEIKHYRVQILNCLTELTAKEALEIAVNNWIFEGQSNKFDELAGNVPEECVPIWLKTTLTIQEAAKYSNIGVTKMRELTNNPLCPFTLFIGKKRLVKREPFEKYINEHLEI